MPNLGWPTKFRIPVRLVTVGEAAMVDEAWVYGFAIGGEAIDEMSHQPGYGCGKRASWCIGLGQRLRRPVLACGSFVRRARTRIFGIRVECP
jgi:hypothetical protein